MAADASAQQEGAEARVLFGKQVYAGGQPCDETGEGRATHVYFRCNPLLQRAEDSRVEIIEEPQLCVYRLIVGTPLLCRNYYAGPAALHRRRLELLGQVRPRRRRCSSPLVVVDAALRPVCGGRRAAEAGRRRRKREPRRGAAAAAAAAAAATAARAAAAAAAAAAAGCGGALVVVGGGAGHGAGPAGEAARQVLSAGGRLVDLRAVRAPAHPPAAQGGRQGRARQVAAHAAEAPRGAS
eukprot:scaffold1464_cov213-Prasinococcus_capsulatus_cf.AAC.2